MIKIQSKMSERAVELLNLPDHPCHILDIGCGSGLSGEVLTEQGHVWVGVDISKSMLGVALEREVMGDLICADVGDGLMFRAGSFDACISISAIQWLCNAETRAQVPQRRLRVFFQSLYRCLCKGARAILQFYPENADQVSMITQAAMRAGFSGGLVVDFPNSTKRKKYFLCLFAGEPNTDGKVPMALKGVAGMDVDAGAAAASGSGAAPQNTVLFSSANGPQRKREKWRKGNKRAARPSYKSRAWIRQKKDSARRAGKRTARDSKYSGRKRKPKF